MVMIGVEKRGGDEIEGIELGVKWVRWVVGESVLPKCLTFHVPRVVENSRKLRKLRKSTSSLFFPIQILTLLMFLDSASSRLAFIFRFDLQAMYS